MPMYDPPHPGAVLESCFIDDRAIEDAIATTGIPRAVFMDILQGKASITPEIAFMLTKVIPLHTPGFWIGLQAKYDTWQATHNLSWQEKVQQKFRGFQKPSATAGHMSPVSSAI